MGLRSEWPFRIALLSTRGLTKSVSGAASFLALILDQTAKLPKIDLLPNRERDARLPVESIPNIVNDTLRSEDSDH